MLRFLFFAILLTLTGARVRAQQTISGRVTAASGEALPGANIAVKGTTTGVSTDADGRYSLRVPAGRTKLAVSMIGYHTEEIDLGGRSTLNVQLEEANQKLEEVVITGLATSVKRSSLANAVTTLKAEQLVGTTRPSTLDAALSGKVVGANIVQNSGAPGGGLSVQLRGISSITGNSQPLYIVDGVIINNAQFDSGRSDNAFSGAAANGPGQDNTVNRVADINPADIENIEILKGSSAAAIYGTLANAGVILITTKKGQAGKTRINFGQDFGAVQAIRLLGQPNWDEAKINAFYGAGTDRANQEIASWKQATASGKIYDYEKEIFGNTGFIRNTRLSISGGSEQTKFYLAGGINDETGIVHNTGFTRNSLRANLTHRISSNWDLQFNSNYINSSNRRGWEGNDNNGVNIGTNLPFLPNYAQLHPNPDGTFPDNPYYGENPLAVIARMQNYENTNRFIQSINSTYWILRNERNTLKVNVQGGLDYLLTENQIYAPSDMQSQRNAASGYPGAARDSKNRSLSTNLQAALVYTFTRGNVTGTTSAGAVRYNQSLDVTAVQGEGLPAGQSNPNVGALKKTFQYFQPIQTAGAFVQQELNYKDMLVGTVAVRVDKNSINSAYNKFYAFPKLALAADLTKLGVLHLPQLNQFKLRVAYGQTGAPAPFGSSFTPLNVLTYDGKLGIGAPTTVGNNNLRYENASELEYGADISMWQGRLTLEATLYDKVVKNLLQTYNLAPSTGYQTITGYPVGDLQNRGLELSLGIMPVKLEKFVWTSTTQFWFNRSTITRLTIPDKVVGPGFGYLFGRNELAQGLSPTAWVGTPLVTSPDGTVRPTVYGNAQPRFQMSFVNQLQFLDNWSLSFLVHWRNGGYNSNQTRYLRDQGGTSLDWMVPTDKDASGNPLPNGPLPSGQARLINMTAANFIENAGFVRLREVGLYYTLNKNKISRLLGNFIGDRTDNIKLGVSGNNILTFTRYTGYDPEVSNYGNTSVGAQQDVISYPNTKRFFLHLNITF